MPELVVFGGIKTHLYQPFGYETIAALVLLDTLETVPVGKLKVADGVNEKLLLINKIKRLVDPGASFANTLKLYCCPKVTVVFCNVVCDSAVASADSTSKSAVVFPSGAAMASATEPLPKGRIFDLDQVVVKFSDCSSGFWR